jgi:hypothetical protein
MKSARVGTVLFVLCVGWASAGTQAPRPNGARIKPFGNTDQAVAAVPLPKLSVSGALDIADRLRHSRFPSETSTVVTVDWAKASQFRPRYFDGSDYYDLRIVMYMRGLLPISNRPTDLHTSGLSASDYETTERSEPFKGTEVSRKSIAALIVKTIESRIER